MNHKYRKPKASRAGCLMCKPWKYQARKYRKRAKRDWRDREGLA